MPNKCSVPGCRTNYERTKNDKVDNSPTSIFKFPNDPQRRAFWLSIIPGLHDFIVTENTRVCSKHFLSKFLSKKYSYHYPGKETHLVLSSNAYPTIFPNSTTAKLGDGIKSPERSLLDDVYNGSKTEIVNWVSADTVLDFSSFCEEAENYLDFAGDKWISRLDKEQDIESIQFFFTQDVIVDGPDELSRKSCFTVTVSADMHVKVHSQKYGDIPESSMSWIFGKQAPPVLVYWSQFVTIICQCSVGFWADHNDFNPSGCINDLHELPLLGKQNRDAHSPVEGHVDERQSIHTTEITDVKDDESDNGRLREETQQLTLKLYCALYQRNLLMKMMKDIQDLASINLDILSLSLIMNNAGREEMEKVHRLIQTIMNHAEEMNAGLDDLPVWMKENSELIQKGDPFQVKFPSFQVNLSLLDDCGEMNEKCHSDGDNIMDKQSLFEERDSENVEVNDADLDDDSEMSIEASEPVNDKEYGGGFTCEICADGRRFVRLGHLKAHQSHMHKSNINLPSQCEICGKEFKNYSRCQLHMKSHTEERPFQCIFCGILFKEIATLQKHEKTVHSEERPHVCSICKKSFKRRGYLTQHLQNHTIRWLAFKKGRHGCQTSGLRKLWRKKSPD